MPQPTINPNLPAAARKQVKEANRLIAELNTRPGEVPAPAPQRAQWTPGTPQPAATPSPAAEPVQVEDPVKALEHKYSTLAGKYNSEVSRLTGSVQALMAENARLAETLRQPAPAPAPRAEDRFDTSTVTVKEREEYGEELVNMMARIAKANSAAEVSRLETQIANMRGQVQQTQQIGAQTRMERVWNKLAAEVPGWEIINNSQQFLDWLEIPDIMSGVARKVGVSQAFEMGDGQRVVGIFKRFLEEDSRARSTAPSTPNTAQVDPATLIAPGAPRGSGGEAPNGASGKIWSEQEINDFYSRVQRKRISADEAKAIEADILLAVQQNRVRPDRDDRYLANAR